MNTINLSRRKFMTGTAVAGGGLVMGFTLTGCSRLEWPMQQAAGDFVPNAFLQITPDNLIRFYCPRDEMGQGVTTGLGTLIGEELDVPPQDLDIILAGAHLDYTNPALGVQTTGGSSSIRGHFLPLRQAAANTRAVLLEAAARDLGLDKSRLSTEDGHVVAGGERHPYGRFVATAMTLEASDDVPLKASDHFRYIGKTFPRLDGLEKSTGTAVFGIDVDVPGMHHAVVRRSPVAGAKLVSVDTEVAKKMPGVTDVFTISSGIAVVAEKYWQAKRAADILNPAFEDVPLAQVGSDQVRADYAAAMRDEPGTFGPEEGDIETGFAAATTTMKSEYWTPYLAHAPLEPMNAVLRIENGEADLWTGTQGPGFAQGLVARVSGLPEEKIRVHSTYLGGGFGRRSILSHIVEVTEIAMVSGKPIHLLWSREDDIRNGLYRPASLMTIRAGADSDGKLTAWQAKRVGGNVLPDTMKHLLPGIFPNIGQSVVNFTDGLIRDVFSGWFVDPTSLEGFYEDYGAPNVAVSHVTVNHGVPLTSWRSVGHSYTAFAKESLMDELAEKAGIDEVEFRLRNTEHNPRLNNVIKVAGEHMRRMKPADGRFLGFAAHRSFMTDVAEIAEVSVENNRIRVHKVTCVVDCGLAVNPDVVRAQMEGGIMFGLTAALHGELTLEGGRIKESNFHDYPLLRMNEAPAVEVVIIDNGTQPTGVGEPGLPPIAPAVANAVYKATGQRLRSLPLRLNV